MKQKLILHLPLLVTLHSFTVFPEYFIGISLIYILIVVVLSSYNIYGCAAEKLYFILIEYSKIAFYKLKFPVFDKFLNIFQM